MATTIALTHTHSFSLLRYSYAYIICEKSLNPSLVAAPYLPHFVCVCVCVLFLGNKWKNPLQRNNVQRQVNKKTIGFRV